MSSNEMTCAELVEVVTDYIEGALPARELSRLEEHLETCDGCRAYIEQMRTTIELLGSAPKQPQSSTELEPLLKAFRAWKKEQKS